MRRSSMIMRRSLVVAGLVSFVGLFARPAMADTITNGNFQTGTLAGWTVFTTSNGTNGTGLPNVVSFNTTGVAPALRRTSMSEKEFSIRINHVGGCLRVTYLTCAAAT